MITCCIKLHIVIDHIHILTGHYRMSIIYRTSMNFNSRKEQAHLDDEQARCFVKALAIEPDIRVKTLLTMLLYSDVRIGGLCGLEWRDINWR